MYDNIKKAFVLNSNEANAFAMSKYMRDKFSFYGIKADKRRALYKDFIKSQKSIDWDIIYEAWNDDKREGQYFALDYLMHFRKSLTWDDIENLEKLARSKAFWDSIDVLDGFFGDIVFESAAGKKLMLDYSLDSDIWIRRIAIDHQLEYGNNTDSKLLEKIIKNNLGTKEFFINKAIGWSLRQYSKFNPVWVKNFLNTNKDSLSSLSIREASRYI